MKKGTIGAAVTFEYYPKGNTEPLKIHFIVDRDFLWSPDGLKKLFERSR